jgi:hypothetical protein
MLKFGITVLGMILLLVGGFYVFGFEPTYIDLYNGENSFNENATQLNQTGKTEPGAVVTINNNTVFVDEDGDFHETITIGDGENLIHITSKAPFKSITKTTIQVNRKNTSKSVHVSWIWNQTIQK